MIEHANTTNAPNPMAIPTCRHILSLSGGKDSTALAVYMRDRVPQMEYVFCDTGKELPETYEYIQLLEAYLGQPVVILKHDSLIRDGDAFEDLLQIKRNYLPSPQMRWCTQELKIRPFEKYVGSETVVNYIGIRADENRKGYISHKPNLTPKYPFIEDGIDREGVIRILEESGLGLPTYYNWRSRSGCYFCFYQQRIEWVGLLENHPELFQRAMSYEKIDPITGRSYSWIDRETLQELSDPIRVEAIKFEHAKRTEDSSLRRSNQPLSSVLFDDDDSSDNQGCLICTL